MCVSGARGGETSVNRPRKEGSGSRWRESERLIEGTPAGERETSPIIGGRGRSRLFDRAGVPLGRAASGASMGGSARSMLFTEDG
jgi:hypothetical protein